MPWFDLADFDLLLAEVATHVSAAGDVDGDGVEDLIVYADHEQDNVADVFLVLGGPAGPVASSWTASGRGLMDQVQSWAGGVGDLDGDGHGEIGVVAGYRYLIDEESIQVVYCDVYAGTPDGASSAAMWSVEFEAGMFDPSLGVPALAGLGDLDGDGHPELGLGVDSLDLVRLYTGGPDGPGGDHVHFHATTAGVPTGEDFGAALGATGDINGDGHGDVWIAADDELRVFLGGAEAPTEAWSLPTTVTYKAAPWAAALGDLDADGFADAGVILDDSVTLVFGDRDATGSRRQELTLAATAAQAFVPRPDLDVNGDGYLDLLALDHRQGAALRGEITLWLGGPSGFEEAASYLQEFTSPEAAVADIDGDGLDDIALVTLEADGSHLRVYRGRTDLAPGTTPSFRDVDGDGYGDATLRRMTPGQAGWVPDGTDCDDTRDDVHPDAVEITNDARDSDCDGNDDPPDTGDGPDTGDTGDTAGVDTGDTAPAADSGDAPEAQPSGCGCSAAAPGAPAGLATALAMVAWRRRRAAGTVGAA